MGGHVNSRGFPDIDHVRVSERSRALMAAVPGLADQEANERARTEIDLMNTQVDGSTRSGSVHILAVALMRTYPGREYRDCVIEADRVIRERGMVPRHPSGVR